LNNSPSSFRRKQDIIKEIEESARTLGLSRSDTSLVFYRSSVEDQVRVSKKAWAYVELLITPTCLHLLKSPKFTGNHEAPLRPHKLNDLLHRLHERLGCRSQHSIPIGFFYAKWSEKLHFHLARANRQERSHSTASSTRTRTPSPTPAPTRSPNPPVQDIKSPIMASSSAAARAMTVEEAEANLNEIREKRAATYEAHKGSSTSFRG
jgi:hypothetical protein